MGARHGSVHNHRDANEPQLLAIAAQMGVGWTEGTPLDGWIHLPEHVPVEIKNPASGGAERFTDSEIEFLARCCHMGWTYFVWRTPDDVIASLNNYRRGNRHAYDQTVNAPYRRVRETLPAVR